MNDQITYDRIVARCVAQGDCLVWTGCRLPKGYGQIRITRRGVAQTHRAIYEAIHGPIAPGLVVMHSCDNPPCCNPAHLSLGTIADNQRDMANKGRAARMRNEASGKAKLTDAQVAEIRAKAGSGIQLTMLAPVYGVHPSHLSRIVRGVRRPTAARRDGFMADAKREGLL